MKTFNTLCILAAIATVIFALIGHITTAIWMAGLTYLFNVGGQEGHNDTK